MKTKITIFLAGIVFLLAFLLSDNLSIHAQVPPGPPIPNLNTSGVSASPALGYSYPVSVTNCPANGYLMCNVTSRFGTQRIRCPAPLNEEPCTRTGPNSISCRVRFTTEGSWSIQANCGASAPDVGGMRSGTSRSFSVAEFNPAPSGPPPISGPAPSDDPSTTMPPSDPGPGSPAPGSGQGSSEATPTPTPVPLLCPVCTDENRFYNKAYNACCRTRGCDVPNTGGGGYITAPTITECERGKEYCLEGRGCNPSLDATSPPCYDENGDPIENIDGVCPNVKFGDASIPNLFLSTSAGTFIGQVLGVLLSISGMVAVALIIMSGYQYMTSRGNPDAIQAAKDRLTSALVGLLFIIFSIVILTVIGVDILQIPGFGN